MSRRDPISLFQLERFEKTLQTGSREARRRVLDRLRDRLGIPADERGTPDLLRRLTPAELNNLRGWPLTAAVLLRTRTDGPDYLLYRLEEGPPMEWASRTLIEALPTLPVRLLRWTRGCFIHGNLPIRTCAPALLSLLSCPDPAVRKTAAVLLREACLKPVPHDVDLQRLADDPVPEVRDLALAWMAQAAGEFIERTIPALGSIPAKQRRPLSARLAQLTRILARAIPDLELTPGIRTLAHLLMDLREASYRIVPRLLRAVGSADPLVSREAVEGLLANWRRGREDRPRVRRLERSPHEHVRANAVRLLPLFDEEPATLTPRLRELVLREASGVGVAALEVLSSRGALLAEDRPGFQARVDRWGLLDALKGSALLGSATPALLRRALRAPDSETRRLGISLLAPLDPWPPDLRRALRFALADRDINVRMAALDLLERRSAVIRRDAPRIRALMNIPCWKGNTALYWRRRLRRWLR